MRRRAVVTGWGIVSPFGVGRASFVGALAEGRAAVGPMRRFDVSTLPVRVGGEVHADLGLPESTMPLVRDRKAGFALVAAREAWAHAGCGPDERGASLSIALGLEQAFLDDFAPIFDGRLHWERAGAAVDPRLRYRTPVDSGARTVVGDLGLDGPMHVHVSACAAGGLAVAHAASLVSRGEADVVLAGAADSMLNPLGLGGMARLGATSPRHEPDACRPFDRRRDGLAVGEGAAMFVVEEEQRARARGAKPLLAIDGWGSTQDGHRATAPRPDGSRAAAAMQQALKRAGLDAGAVDYVNAHGTGTPLNDPAEARAINAALDGRRVPVSSIKGAVGHLMAAAGAVELASCLLPSTHGLVPGTAHHRELDPECDLDVVGEAPRRLDAEVMLSNSFGFGGQNVTLLVRRLP